MSAWTPTPSEGLLIIGLTVVGMILLIALVMKVTEWVVSGRDELRDRYASDSWKPARIDLLAFPMWLALELLCLLGAIAIALLTLLLAYEAAKGARDWWHAGKSSRGR